MGNFLNKEWMEQVDDEDDYETKPTEASSDMISSSSPLIDASNSLNKRKSSRNSLAKKNSVDGDESDVKTPITNKTTKMVIADFDPRSPSADIVRTPIFYATDNSGGQAANNNNNNGAQSNVVGKSFVNKAMINDPRSPTTEYNRTPIHCNTASANQASEASSHDDYSHDSSSSSLDSSSLIGSSDLSGLYQTVPEGQQGQQNAAHESSPSFFGSKFANSNMPRHILQRKQVEKLNKKKLTDLEKENA